MGAVEPVLCSPRLEIVECKNYEVGDIGQLLQCEGLHTFADLL